MKKITFLALVAVAMLTSCSKNFYSHRSVNIERKNLLVNPVVTDLTVDLTKKITAESDKKKTIEAAKDDAYYKAITENNIDVLVDPIYNITNTPQILCFGGKSIAKVTGFSGKYTNVKNVTEALKQYGMDTTNVQNFIRLQENSTISKTPSNFDKPVDSRSTKAVSLIVAIVAALVVLSKVL